MRLGSLIAGMLALVLPSLAGAGELKVRFHDIVKPDADLQAFVQQLTSLNAAAGTLDYRAIEGLFAPRVKVFSRGLDPFQPWHRGEPLTGDYLRGAANVIVEQGDLQEGAAPPDYRPDAIKAIAEQVSGAEPFGRMKEMPGAVCAPAEYEVNRKAALAFARKFELDAYSLRFYSRERMLYAKPNLKSELVAVVPPHTLMMFDYDPKAKEPWGLYESSAGKKGYMIDDQPTLGLSQYHVCFGKVKGRYRVVALFGYGL